MPIADAAEAHGQPSVQGLDCLQRPSELFLVNQEAVQLGLLDKREKEDAPW